MVERDSDKQPTPAPSGRETPSGSKPGRFRAFYDRLRGGSSAEQPAAAASESAANRAVERTPRSPAAMPERIGRYQITRKLGQGGMGVVYAARDERLGRTVALKLLATPINDETGRKRFWREARAAASVNHPNICQVYEIGEDQGELFIAMELLEGQSLSERLANGALSVADTIPIGLDVLAALSALHTLGLVHRDLKPSNVFLTPHGVKLLDFGLARPVDSDGTSAFDTETNLTRTGLVMGTPRYMAPEQISGETLDARSDLFALGAILFEMLAGRPAFEGRNPVEILHATLHEQPPALTGSPAIAATDRVIRRALAKQPADRPASADVMATELRAVQGTEGDNTRALARPLTRLVVLPFRVLRADPETDFLAFSLPDAIATSLAGIDSLVVRSSATAARFDRESPDLKAVAAEADVDLVVLGTLLRAGDEVRAAAQLVEAPAGTLLASRTVQSSLGDLFRLQDDVVRGVVEALSLPLAGRGGRPTADTPRNARAYEFYLRGNDLARNTYDQLPLARDLYLQCVEQDPGFAPAWAHLGRCHMIIGKYIEDPAGNYERSEKAFQRALELSPELSVAHRFHSHLQADMGRARQAMVTLLEQASRHSNDPDLLAGLVHVCRYCGLFEQSLAAHDEARRLDPNIPTSFEQTLLMAGDFDRLLVQGSRTNPVRAAALVMTGRRDKARILIGELRELSSIPAFRKWLDWLMAWVEERHDDMRALTTWMKDSREIQDPESYFMEGWMACGAGLHDLGFPSVQRAIEGGYAVATTLATAKQFEALRGDPAFQALQRTAEANQLEALAAFRAAGGERLLGT